MSDDLPGDQEPQPPGRVDRGELTTRYLFEMLMNYIPDVIFFKDTESRFVAVSAQFAHLCDLEHWQQAIGRSDFDFFPREQAERYFADEQEIIRSGKPIIGKQENPVWSHGGGIHCSTTKLPLRDKDGTIIGTFGIGRDISDLKRVEAELAASLELVNAQNEAMRKDLERARIIQKALLPGSAPHHERLKLAYRSRPMEAIGGDVFSFLRLPGDALGVFIGDLAGHGVSAALFMALTKFLVDHLGAECGTQPRAFLEEMNRQLIDRMPSSFLTALYGVFEPQPTGVRLTLAGAGHPPAICYRAASGSIERLQAQGNGALGLFGEFQTEPLTLDLLPGDRIFLYTDGVTETINLGEEFLGERGLVQLVQECTMPDLDAMLTELVNRIAAFRGQASIADDLVLMGIEII